MSKVQTKGFFIRLTKTLDFATQVVTIIAIAKLQDEIDDL